jgi:CheY-like chemotaxis protein
MPDGGDGAGTYAAIVTAAGGAGAALATFLSAYLTARMRRSALASRRLAEAKARRDEGLAAERRRLDDRADRLAQEDGRQIERLGGEVTALATRLEDARALTERAETALRTEREAHDATRARLKETELERTELRRERDRLAHAVQVYAEQETVRITKQDVEQARQKREQEARQLAGLTVAVVDDSPEMLPWLRLVLTTAGAEVRTSATAEAALRSLDVWAPQAIVADMRLPGMPGEEFVRRVREKTQVPVVGISGFPDAAARSAALEAGCDEFLAKPFSGEALVAAVAAMCGRG